jgi:LPS export ABC transporter protein LptC
MAACLAASACGRRGTPPKEVGHQLLEGLTLSQSDRGSPAWTLHSRAAVLHEDDRSASLETPVMEFYKGSKAVSRVTALTGEVQTLTHDVRLSSSVVLDSYEDHSRLTTNELLYSAQTRHFHTDSPVVVKRPEGVIRGEGMDASPDLTEIHIYRQRSVLAGKPK